MARVDALIFFIAAFAQLIIASEVEALLISTILQGTGSGTLALGVYFLIFVARHQKDFNERYSKAEKTILIRNPQTGELTEEDATTATNKALMYVGPVALTILSALVLLI